MTKIQEVAEAAEALGKTAEEVVDAIDRIDNAMKALETTKLNRKALILLISNASGFGMADTERFLTALAELRTRFIKAD